MPALQIAHTCLLSLWAGGLVALSAAAWRRSEVIQKPALGQLRRWGLGLCAYGAILTGVWILHKDQPLLTQRYIHLKAMMIAGLFVADYGLYRRFAGQDGGPLRAQLLSGMAALSAVGLLLVSLVKPWA